MTSIEAELEALLDRLADNDAPVLSYLERGLQPHEVDDLLAVYLNWPSDVLVPEEAYEWWGWQNGPEANVSRWLHVRGLAGINPAGFAILSLETLCRAVASSVDGFPDLAERPVIPLGHDGLGGYYGLINRPNAGIWEMSYLPKEPTAWLPIDEGRQGGLHPTLKEYLTAMIQLFDQGRIMINDIGEVRLRNGEPRGGVASYPWQQDPPLMIEDGV